MNLFLIVMTFLYIALIMVFTKGFKKVKIIENRNTAPKNKFSIVVPFRNEASNLPKLLNSISLINYPKNLFEVILVNDESNDGFKSVISNFQKEHPTLNFALVNKKNITGSPKKDAIHTAITHSNFEWIVTTDADCQVPNTWLQLFNQFIEKSQSIFISAPVKFHHQKSFLFHFQNLNFISLIGSTIGGFGINKPFMCNGANLCYNKAAFFNVNGFYGNQHIASGDDIFLLEKFKKVFPQKVNYLKSIDATVLTSAQKNWKLFFNQQLRWASKTGAYKNGFAKFVGIIVFLMNFSLILTLASAIILPNYWNLFLILFSLKLLVDYLLIFKTTSFLKTKKSLNYYLAIAIAYPFFIVFTACLTSFKSYQWKGRNFNK